MLRIAQAFEKTFGSRSHRKRLAFSLLHFCEAAKAGKHRLLELKEHSELSSFTNMVAEIDTDALKI